MPILAAAGVVEYLHVPYLSAWCCFSDISGQFGRVDMGAVFLRAALRGVRLTETENTRDGKRKSRREIWGINEKA